MIWRTSNFRLECHTFLESCEGGGYNRVIGFAIGLLVPKKINKNWYFEGVVKMGFWSCSFLKELKIREIAHSKRVVKNRQLVNYGPVMA